jgi:hypothetical protein
MRARHPALSLSLRESLFERESLSKRARHPAEPAGPGIPVAAADGGDKGGAAETAGEEALDALLVGAL